jgi:O-antigen/teichoic acid export membrane protein
MTSLNSFSPSAEKPCEQAEAATKSDLAQANKRPERISVTLLVAYLSTGLAQIATQVYFYLIFRFLSLDDIGVLSLAIAISTIVFYVMDLGVVNILIREVGRDRFSFKQVTISVLIMRVPVLLGFLIILQLWAVYTGARANTYWAVLLMGLVGFLAMVELTFISWLQVRQRQSLANLLAIAMPLSRLLGVGLALLAVNHLTLGYVLLVAIVSQILSLAILSGVAWHDSRDMKQHVDVPGGVFQLIRKFWQSGPAITAVQSLGMVQGRLDWLLVASLVSVLALSNYSLANRLLEVLVLFGNILARTSYPWMCRQDAKQLKPRLDILLILLVWMGSVVSLAGVLLGPSILEWLFQAKFREAEPILQMLMLVGGIFVSNQMLHYMALAHKLERKLLWVFGLATVLQVIINLWLLPTVGIVGAAWGMIIFGATSFCGLLGLLLINHVLAPNLILRVVGFHGLLVIVAALCIAFKLSLLMSSGIMALIVVLASFFLWTKSDAQFIRAWIKSVLVRRLGPRTLLAESQP